MSNRKYPAFNHFITCYWNQDGVFEYGNIENSIRDFSKTEGINQTAKLLKDFKSLIRQDLFSNNKYKPPGYMAYLEAKNYKNITGNEANTAINLIENILLGKN